MDRHTKVWGEEVGIRPPFSGRVRGKREGPIMKVKEDLSRMTCAGLEGLLDKIEEEIRVHAHSTPSIDASRKGDEEVLAVSPASSWAEVWEWTEKDIQLRTRRLEVIREYQKICEF